MLLKKPRMAGSIISTTMLLFTTPVLRAKTSEMALGDAQGGTQWTLG